MTIKYISIILGTIFEIYCIDKFISIYSPRKEMGKYKYYLLFILISICYISKSFFLNGISMAIASLIAKFLFTQLYRSKQYVKMIISISLSVLYVSSELLFGGIFMLISGAKHMEINTSPEAYAIGTLLSKFFVFVIILIFESKKKSIVISNLTPTYLTLLSVLPITTITLDYLFKSASNGYKYALYQLGKIYYNGKYVEKDISKSIQYLISAAEKDCECAEKLLEYITNSEYKNSRNIQSYSAVLAVLNDLSKLFKKEFDKKYKLSPHTDRKTLQKINEKKQAQGLKSSM